MNRAIHTREEWMEMATRLFPSCTEEQLEQMWEEIADPADAPAPSDVYLDEE